MPNAFLTSHRERRSYGRWIGGWGYRLILWPLFAMALLIVVGRFAPVSSTLMLYRWIVGEPVKREWVSLDAMSPQLAKAVIASEDQLFCSHWGVDFDVLKELMLDPDGPSRGGSTISMQVAKNVFLWHGRSYVRKAIEIPLALTIDAFWGKRRMMEVYLNVVEWGDGLFGAEAAAQHYFHKSVTKLNSAEAARLAAALPNPDLRGSSAPTRHSRRVGRLMSTIEPYVACVH